MTGGNVKDPSDRRLHPCHPLPCTPPAPYGSCVQPGGKLYSAANAVTMLRQCWSGTAMRSLAWFLNLQQLAPEPSPPAAACIAGQAKAPDNPISSIASHYHCAFLECCELGSGLRDFRAMAIGQAPPCWLLSIVAACLLPIACATIGTGFNPGDVVAGRPPALLPPPPAPRRAACFSPPTPSPRPLSPLQPSPSPPWAARSPLVPAAAACRWSSPA